MLRRQSHIFFHVVLRALLCAVRVVNWFLPPTDVPHAAAIGLALHGSSAPEELAALQYARREALRQHEHTLPASTDRCGALAIAPGDVSRAGRSTRHGGAQGGHRPRWLVRHRLTANTDAPRSSSSSSTTG